MKEVTTIGVDLAKNVFDVHGTGAEAAVPLCLRRSWSRFLCFAASLD